jgi:hypothetical protein
MEQDILRKAVFLVRDCHESEQQAVEGLKRYFPGLALHEREHYVSQAWDLVHGLHGVHGRLAG